MILRVPDYYETFRCIAGACKDSCCIGWEIDIDEDTYSYYRNIEGAFGQRLCKSMVPIPGEEGYQFALAKGRRCPFLNDQNLCDICIELGEEALSEVCTEYPRFSLYYGNTLQKCLSLSCEEVDRILFEKAEPVKFLELPMMEEDEELEAWEQEGFAFFEEIQKEAIDILQNRDLSIWERMELLLCFLELVQAHVNTEGEEGLQPSLVPELFAEAKETFPDSRNRHKLRQSYKDFEKIFALYDQLEVLDSEWSSEKRFLSEILGPNQYEKSLAEFLVSSYIKESDYEQLVVYFFFRYFMQSVYDFNLYSKGLMAIEFTLMIRDMDLARFVKNKKHDINDRMNTARIFSKEVEHSEENVSFMEENVAFLP